MEVLKLEPVRFKEVTHANRRARILEEVRRYNPTDANGDISYAEDDTIGGGGTTTSQQILEEKAKAEAGGRGAQPASSAIPSGPEVPVIPEHSAASNGHYTGAAHPYQEPEVVDLTADTPAPEGTESPGYGPPPGFPPMPTDQTVLRDQGSYMGYGGGGGRVPLSRSVSAPSAGAQFNLEHELLDPMFLAATASNEEWIPVPYDQVLGAPECEVRIKPRKEIRQFKKDREVNVSEVPEYSSIPDVWQVPAGQSWGETFFGSSMQDWPAASDFGQQNGDGGGSGGGGGAVQGSQDKKDASAKEDEKWDD